MCQAYKLGMTQREGYVWFLPGWFKERWFDVDLLRWSEGKIFVLVSKSTPQC